MVELDIFKIRIQLKEIMHLKDALIAWMRGHKTSNWIEIVVNLKMYIVHIIYTTSHEPIKITIWFANCCCTIIYGIKLPLVTESLFNYLKRTVYNNETSLLNCNRNFSCWSFASIECRKVRNLWMSLFFTKLLNILM